MPLGLGWSCRERQWGWRCRDEAVFIRLVVPEPSWHSLFFLSCLICTSAPNETESQRDQELAHGHIQSEADGV